MLRLGTALGQGPHFALTCGVLWPVLSSDLEPAHGGSWSRAWLQVRPGQLAKTWVHRDLRVGQAGPAEEKLGLREGIAQGVRSGKGLARVRQISRHISRNPNLPPCYPPTLTPGDRGSWLPVFSTISHAMEKPQHRVKCRNMLESPWLNSVNILLQERISVAVKTQRGLVMW